MELEDEEMIIQSVVDGNIQDYRKIVEFYLAPLQRFLQPLLRDWQTAEDVAQEALVRAFQHLESYDVNRSQFKTWLFTIARRRALQSIKKHRALPMETLPESPDMRLPSDALERKEIQQRMNDAIGQLAPELKIVIELLEVEGWSLEDVAQLEGKPIGTIKSRSHRARKKLRKILNNQGSTV